MKLLQLDNKNSVFIRNTFLGLVIVMSINALSLIIVSLVDTACITAYIGDNGLAAISLVSPLNQIIYGFSSLFSVGSELLITKLLTKGEKKKANSSFVAIILFLFLLGILFFMFMFFGNKFLASILSANKVSEDVLDLTSKYLRGLSFAIPYIFLNELFFSLVYLDNDKIRPTLSVIVLFVSNVTLDIVMAKYFTNKSFAIGLASSISYLLSTLVLLTHFISKKSGLNLSGKDVNIKAIKTSFINGLPVLIKNIATTGRLYLINIIILYVTSMSGKGQPSELIIAAHQIEETITDLFSCEIAGVISAIILLSSIFHNEEDEKSLNVLFKELIKFAIIVGGCLSLIYFFTAPYIAGVWSDDKVVIEHATYAMRAKSITLVFIILSSGFISFFQGFKNHLLADISATLRSFLLPVLFAVIFGFTMGVEAIWIGVPIGYSLYFVLLLIFAFIKNKKIKFDVRTIFFLKDNFGFKDDEIYEKEINNIKDCYSLQNDVLDFCNKFNIDETRKQNLANCAEELAVLIVISGFSKNNKKHKPHITFKVSYKKDDDLLMIRTRDDCEKFDIKEKIDDIKNGKSKDPALNCSIKMILHMAKDIDYSRILKTNNMIIKL